MKLAAVHRPTMAPNQSNDPVRAVSTSWIGPCNTLSTLGGSRSRMVATVFCPSDDCPSNLAIAAAVMKNGNSANRDKKARLPAWMKPSL